MKYRFTNLLGQSTKATRTYQIPLRLKTIKNIATKKFQHVYLLSYVPMTRIKHKKRLFVEMSLTILYTFYRLNAKIFCK